MIVTLNVNIQAPELVGAIQAMANVLTVTKPGVLPGQMELSFNGNPQAPAQILAPAYAPTLAPAPELAQPAQQVQIQQVQPVQQAQPVQPVQTPPIVPTEVQTYTMDQLAVAATQLVDAGRRAELVGLLAEFAVPALTSLPKEHYGNFATRLRAMGAKI